MFHFSLYKNNTNALQNGKDCISTWHYTLIRQKISNMKKYIH